MAKHLTSPVLKRDLTAEFVRARLRYFPETGVFIWLRRIEITQQDRSWNTQFAGKPAGSIDKAGYITIAFKAKHYRAHQLAWLVVTGEWAPGEIDHCDRDKGNNRFANLRPATKGQNAINSGVPANNKCGHRGVHWHAGARRWRAKIKVSGANIHLGYFDKVEDASTAYQAAARQHFGSFGGQP
jgi:hypothetical protein